MVRPPSDQTRAAGFTLIEIIVVLGVIAMLAGSMAPMASATIRAERIKAVETEIEVIADAVAAYYYDKGRFPGSLTANDFYGVYIRPGIGDDRLEDEWGKKLVYRTSRTTNPDTMTVYSVGENGVDNGVTNEEFKTTVQGATPGNKRTRERMALINAAVAKHLAASGTITGNWTTDRAALSLGAEYHNDGFSTAFRLSATTHVLLSAGADRTFNTADDLVP